MWVRAPHTAEVSVAAGTPPGATPHAQSGNRLGYATRLRHNQKAASFFDINW